MAATATTARGPALSVEDLRREIEQLRTTINTQNNAQAPARFRVPDPDTFEGSATKVDNWLFSLRGYFDLQRVPESEKIPLASMFLRGRALIWWRSVVANQTAPSNWAEFERGLLMNFRPTNSVQEARDKLANLRQRQKLSEYHSAFNTLCLQIPDLSDSERFDRYLRGLKTNLRKEIMLRDITNFHEAVVFTEKLDGIERQVLRGALPMSFRQTAAGPTPMEIDAVVVNKPRRSAQKVDPRRSNLRKNSADTSCWNCGEEGHFAADCPQPNAGKLTRRPQLKGQPRT